MAWNFRKGPRTDFQEIMVEFHTVAPQIAAARGRVRVEFNFGRSVIVVCSGAQRTAGGRENVHRCALRDDATVLRACHGCLERGSRGQQGEAQRLHRL